MCLEERRVDYYVPGHRVLTKGNIALAVVLQPLLVSDTAAAAGATGRESAARTAVSALANIEFLGVEPLVVANTHLLFNNKRGDIKLGQLRCAPGAVVMSTPGDCHP